MVDLTRNHDKYIRVHFPPQSFSIYLSSLPYLSLSLSVFLCSLSILNSSLFTFFHLLSPTVSLKHCRHAGLPLPVRRWTSDKAVPAVKFASTSR